MVSALITSPEDQAIIFSGEANLMEIARMSFRSLSIFSPLADERSSGLIISTSKPRLLISFTKTLAAKPSFAAQRLLGDERIGTGGTHMDFVFNHMVKFHDINIAHCYRIFESFAGSAVKKFHFA